ncbi:MAG: zinc ribbon domain-containing protein [Lachnospiraceae bacterium]|nr:zinc ribbon domain-containing protein [Lachnospiraceae bacterium]
MFFIMTITEGRKDIDFGKTVTCAVCGRYGQLKVFVLYTVLSLFFIPAFKWNRRYYVQTSCCGTTYELAPELGRKIAQGEDVEILPEHVRRVSDDRWHSAYKRCSHCGFETFKDYEYCPKCGTRLG